MNAIAIATSRYLSSLLPNTNRRDTKMASRASRGEGSATLSMLAILTIATGLVFGRLLSVTQGHQQLLRQHQQIVDGNQQHRLAEDEALLQEPLMPALPFDIGQRMKEWLAKAQLREGYFYTPQGKEQKMKPYSTKEILNTLPHFTRELLLVAYVAASDEFVVLLPGKAGRREPRCEAGCVRIENIMKAVLYAFRNRFPQRFQQGSQDLMFLVSTGDSPRLSRDCLARPGGCGRRKGFAPILHFGSGFRDPTILPSLVMMPPPPRMHLRCMAEWQVNHEVCEFLLPKRMIEEGVETRGMVFGEHINYNAREKKGDDGLTWDDLIPQLVWRGTDFPFLNLLHPELRPADFDNDLDPKLKAPGGGVGSILEAMTEVYDQLRPRWKAVFITAQAEFEAARRKKEVLPWANMKFTGVAENHVKTDIVQNPFYKRWNDVGIPAVGEEMTSEQLAHYKYHIDLGGGGGTSWSGTIQKLALPGLLFHHETGARDWYHEHLVPWIHYVPVREDLSDLRERFLWAERHERKARNIAKAGIEFVRRMGRPEGLDELYRRHFLRPLENIGDSFHPDEQMPLDSVMSGANGLTFKEIMRCTGYNAEECTLRQ
ncbi:hypothetical protein ACHAXT_006645 [Thalassiosira profunda]